MIKEAIEYLFNKGTEEFGSLEVEGKTVDVKEVGREMTIHIDDPNTVSIYSQLNDERKREQLVIAKAILPNVVYDRFLESENFIIELMSKFEPTEDREKVLKLFGCIKSEQVHKSMDDGLSQTVTAKKGISTVAEMEVPNPVTLAPYRTFPELPQPTSKFVLRLQDGPEAALFNAGGTSWRVEAMQSIKEYLDEGINPELKEFVKIIM
ncbi:MAG: hypothetical protein CVV56_07980 [Tenericutes bacterium HGW-Tenericutes-1]|nr:MAG: hypothetical protein CVV56_07980 [Tenericutes bacterium HGW-Tenericutes-1]